MPAGRPIKVRDTGYTSDLTSLSRLRTAIKIHRGLDRNLVAKAIDLIDDLENVLVQFNDSLNGNEAPKAPDSQSRRLAIARSTGEFEV